MGNNLRILIVEDDVNICNTFQSLIENEPGLELVGITNNSKKAVSLIEDCLPNAVILDLELHVGGGNGIEVLQDVSNLHLPIIPFFIVTTNNTSSVTYEMARSLGADFIMYKHEEGYCERKVIDFLNTMSMVILKNTKTPLIVNETPSDLTRKLTHYIHSQLNAVGISSKVKGYTYLTDAILLIYNDDTYCICNKIASVYNKSESSVERAIQNAINKAWHTTDIDSLLKYYAGPIHSQKGVPTITEFIYYYARLMKNKF